ncbi:MAG TPA: hypothetical protein VIN10_09795 [Bacteroidales bacterium]
MKTKLQTSALILILSVTSIQISASDFQLKDEAYINDIPFNTEMVVNNMLAERFDLEEENYINDIPFNTSEIAFESENSDSINFEMEEEAYINDIPFNTGEIVDTHNYETAMNQVFEMPEEKNIDDIPFNTVAIAKKVQQDTISDFVASAK